MGPVVREALLKRSVTVLIATPMFVCLWERKALLEVYKCGRCLLLTDTSKYLSKFFKDFKVIINIVIV